MLREKLYIVIKVTNLFMKFSIFYFFNFTLALKIISNPWSIAKTGAVVGAHMKIKLFIFCISFINNYLFKNVSFNVFYLDEFDVL